MTKQFVTYEIALKLKELGFDEPCFGYYTPMKKWMMEETKLNPERHFHGCNWANSDNSMYFMYKQNSFGDRDSVVKNSEFTKAIHNVAVPLWQQVIDWFWDNYKILVYPYLVPDKTKTIMWITKYQHEDFWSTKEQAILKAIELCKKN